MKRLAMVAIAVTLGACGAATGDPRTQLEYNVGIPREEAGQYTTLQLATIKQVQNRDYQKDHQKEKVIARIKDGRYPIFVLGF